VIELNDLADLSGCDPRTPQDVAHATSLADCYGREQQRGMEVYAHECDAAMPYFLHAPPALMRSGSRV
jgi:hypothetical protein